MTAERSREETRKDESPPSESVPSDLARSEPAPSESAPSMASVWARAIEKAESAARQSKEQSDAGERPDPGSDEDPNRREAVSVLLRAIESSDYAARMQPPEPDRGRRPEPAQDEDPNRREAASILLRAIESSEFAASLEQEASGIAQPDLARPSELPKSDDAVPASTPLDHPHAPAPVRPSGSAAREKAPDSVPASRSAAVAERSPEAPSAARLEGEARRLSPKIVKSTRVPPNSAGERLSTRLLNWLSAPPPPRDKRGATRLANPPLVAFYWTGGAPRPRAVADISSSGLYLVTPDRWSPGTQVSMTLQRTDQKRGAPGTWIAVDVKIVRLRNNGFGGAFVPSKLPAVTGLAHTAARGTGNRANKETLERFVKHLTAPTQL